jgi:hypothetical protein
VVTLRVRRVVPGLTSKLSDLNPRDCLDLGSFLMGNNRCMIHTLMLFFFLLLLLSLVLSLLATDSSLLFE